MRVLITTDTLGGVWRYSINLIKSLEKHNVEVTLATIGPLPDENQMNEVRRLKGVSIYSVPYKLEWMDDPWKDIEKTQRWLLNLCFDVQPDIIHFNSFAFDSSMYSAPTVMVGHSCVLSWWEAVKNEAAPPSLKQYEETVRKGLQSADIVVAPSAFMMESLTKYYGPFNKSRVIYNAVDKEDYYTGQKERMIFSMGRLWDEAKNIPLLIEAAMLLPYTFYIAGDAKNKVDKKFLPANVHLLGQLSNKEIARYLSIASIFALPALYEPFGLSAVEAAFSGCALILGDIPSQREIWKEHAIYCNPCDAEDLAGKIMHLINDPELRNQMANEAMKRAANFQLPNEMAEYYVLYKNLIEESNAYRKQKQLIKI